MITGDIPQPKIILEGTHLTRKTDVAFALAEHVEIVGQRKRRWHIPLISAEWETRSDKQPTKEEPGRSMIVFEDGDEDWVNECYDNYVRMLELHRDYYWIVDRFHISTMSYQQQVKGRQFNLGWVDGRLAKLGFVLVHLVRQPNSFPSAREHRLTYSENPHRYNNLDLFIDEQKVMAKLIKASALKALTIDVTEKNVEHIARVILDWTKEIGAFWRKADLPQ